MRESQFIKSQILAIIMHTEESSKVPDNYA